MTEVADFTIQNLVEKICELDDDLMMQYLEGEEPSIDDMKKLSEKLHASVQQFLYAVVLLTETKVFRSSLMQSSSTCLLQQISQPIKGVDEDGNE